MTFNDSLVTTINSRASEYENAVDSALGDLRSAASSYFSPKVTQAGFDNNPAWVVGEGREIVLSGLGDLPVDIPVLTIPPFNFNPEDYMSANLLAQNSYQSDFFDNILQPKVEELLEAQSYFINQAVQDALFEAMYNRDLQTLSDATDAVDRLQARTGFPLPNSMTMAARNDVIKKYQDTRNDRNKEVTALIAERAHAGMLHAMDVGVRMEDIRSKFQLEFGRIYWMAGEYLIRKYEADLKAELAQFNSELELIKESTAVNAKMADFDLEYERMTNAQQLARLEATVKEMDGAIVTWKQHVTGEMEAAAASAEYYGKAAAAWMNQILGINYEDTTA